MLSPCRLILPRQPIREAVQDAGGGHLGGLDGVGVDVGGSAGLGVAQVVGDSYISCNGASSQDICAGCDSIQPPVQQPEPEA